MRLACCKPNCFGEAQGYLHDSWTWLDQLAKTFLTTGSAEPLCTRMNSPCFALEEIDRLGCLSRPSVQFLDTETGVSERAIAVVQ